VAKAAIACKKPCKPDPKINGIRGFLRMARNLHHALRRMGASTNQRPNAHADNRRVRILAKSVYRELRNSGHSRSDIVAFTNAVLELVTSELRDAQEAAE
jgi:hypothetical protein